MESKIIEQLRADLASENQEITYVIESQEGFLSYLESKLDETQEHRELVQEIIDKFKGIMI